MPPNVPDELVPKAGPCLLAARFAQIYLSQDLTVDFGDVDGGLSLLTSLANHNALRRTVCRTTRSAAPGRVLPTGRGTSPASARAHGYISPCFSGCQFDEVRLDPHLMPRFGPQFNINTLVETPNAIPLSNHTLEQIFCTKLVLNTRGVIAWPIFDNLYDVAQFQCLLWHI
jgi:hypothetical protein